MSETRPPACCSRRRWLALSAAIAGAGLAAPPRAVGQEPMPGDAAPLAMTEIAPGRFVHAGAVALAAPDNQGAIANIGFVVGEEAVAVIDSGGSAATGARLRAAIRARTGLPIRYVIATHVHPDHGFGHAAFLADDPAFVGHAKLPAALAARGGFYLDGLRAALGPAAAGTLVVAPTLLVEDRLTLDLGGVRLALRAHPTAHTDHDLSVFDPASGTLWAGDLLFMDHCPVIDGSLLGWLEVMAALRAIDALRVVPGHGPASAPWPASLAPQARYLAALRDQTRALLAEGGTLEEAIETVGRDLGAGWALFEAFHGRNVTAAYTELEWE